MPEQALGWLPLGLVLVMEDEPSELSCTCACAHAIHYRDVGVKAIENLMEKKGKFDYILLETTGLADPGPIASMFWLDEGLGSEIYLDGMYIHVELT